MVVLNVLRYLGIVLSIRGSFIHATNTIVAKGLRTMGSRLHVTKQLCVPIATLFHLVDAYVTSILNYGCEQWGFKKYENIERVHRQFCKYRLHVKMTTHSYAQYSEVGRVPLYIERYVLIAKNVLKLFHIHSSNCILKTSLLKCQYNRVNSNVRYTDWTKQVRDMSQNSGFNDVWCFPESVNETMFIPLLRHWYLVIHWYTCTTSLRVLIC